MKREEMENATDVKVTKKASKNVLRSLSVGLAAMMALSTPIATFAEDVDAQNGDGETPDAVTSTKSEDTQAAQLQGASNVASETIKDAQNAVGNVKTEAENLKASYAESDTNAKEKAETVENLASAGDETLQDKLTNAKESVDKATGEDLSDVAANKDATDKALDSVSDKVDEVTEIVGDVNSKVNESNTAISEAKDQIDNATTIEDAQEAYNTAQGVVGTALADIKAAEELYNQKLIEYENAKKALEDAQNKYNDAVAITNSDVNTAYSELIEAEQKAQELKDAAEKAQAAVPELTDAQKAALEIVRLQEESKKNNTAIQWSKIDTQFNIIVEKYYVPEILKIADPVTVKCEWKKNSKDDEQNYCEVTITYADGQQQKKYINYKLTDNNTGDDLIVFDKVVDIKNADGTIAETVKLEDLKVSTTKNIDGKEYSIVNVDGQYYLVDAADTTEEINVENKEADTKYRMNATAEETISYKVDENGKLVKVITGDITSIKKYENQKLDADKYDEAKKERNNLSSEGWDLNETTLDATVKSSFSLTIDMSQIKISTKVIANDNDKKEKASVKTTANTLLNALKNEDTIRQYLGLEKNAPFTITIAADNVNVNDASVYKNETNPKKWYDQTDVWEAARHEKAVYSGIFTGKIVITISTETRADLANMTEKDANDKQNAMKASTKDLLDTVKTDNLLSALQKDYNTANATKRKDTTNSVIFNGINKSDVSSTISYSYSGEKRTNVGKGTKTITYNDTKGTKLSNTDCSENATLTGVTASAKKASEEQGARAAKAKQLAEDAEAAKQKVTEAKIKVRDLTIKLGGLWETVGYTNTEVLDLQAQLEQAEKDLAAAQEKADELNDALDALEEQRDSKIADLTPAPAPVPDGNGSTTNPSGSETAPAGAPSGTTATPTVSTTTAVAAETALADAAPIEIAETPVALAATAPTAVATAAGTNNAANANTDANADDNVVIEDEETPLADNGAQDEETTSIIDEATPLAAEAGAMENMQQEKMSWWWLLIIALLGVTGEEMYRRNKKKKAEAAEKNEK